MTVTAPVDTAWKAVELFGGAITAKFPERFGDISDVRPVPDHQEVGAPAKRTHQMHFCWLEGLLSVCLKPLGIVVQRDAVQQHTQGGLRRACMHCANHVVPAQGPGQQ